MAGYSPGLVNDLVHDLVKDLVQDLVHDLVDDLVNDLVNDLVHDVVVDLAIGHSNQEHLQVAAAGYFSHDVPGGFLGHFFIFSCKTNRLSLL